MGLQIRERSVTYASASGSNNSRTATIDVVAARFASLFPHLSSRWLRVHIGHRISDQARAKRHLHLRRRDCGITSCSSSRLQSSAYSLRSSQPRRIGDGAAGFSNSKRQVGRSLRESGYPQLACMLGVIITSSNGPNLPKRYPR